MTNIQIMETLNKVLNDLYNTLDELDDIEGNETVKIKTEGMILNASMVIDQLIDDLDNQAHIEGMKSGAY